MAPSHSPEMLRRKIHRSNDAPSEEDNQISGFFLDLESSNKDMKKELHDLQISRVKKFDFGGKSSYVIYVPFVLHGKFKKIQARLTRELEKKLSGSPVMFIAERQILSNNYTRSTGKPRPRSRTLSSVHNETLADITYPAPIVGRRIRFKQDGTRVHKIFLDGPETGSVDYKLEALERVYTALTNKVVKFSFQQQ